MMCRYVTRGKGSGRKRAGGKGKTIGMIDSFHIIEFTDTNENRNQILRLL